MAAGFRRATETVTAIDIVLTPLTDEPRRVIAVRVRSVVVFATKEVRQREAR
jgi:hypothetical protein